MTFFIKFNWLKSWVIINFSVISVRCTILSVRVVYAVNTFAGFLNVLIQSIRISALIVLTFQLENSK
jgi:hypothetical protein